MKSIFPTWAFILGLLITLNILILHSTYSAGIMLSDEGGFIETISAFAFMFSAILLFFRALHKEGFELRLTLLFGVTCLLLFLREVDLDELQVPYLIQFFGAESGRDYLFSMAYIGIIGMILWKDRPDFKRKVSTCLRSPVSVAVLIGCVTLVIGSFFEKRHLVLAEELLEMNGSLFILLASLIHLVRPIYSNQENTNHL